MNQLHREVLYFSISHDHTIVKIFGHYPLIKEDKTHFHQHIIKTFDLSDNDGGDRWTAYNFVRKLYDYFAPIHLQRIRDAIPYLPEPASESFISTTSVETRSGVPDSQETAASASSQNTETFKKPRLPPKSKQTLSKVSEARLQEENDVYKTENNALKMQLNTVITQMQTSNANSGNDSEVVTLLRQQNTE